MNPSHSGTAWSRRIGGVVVFLAAFSIFDATPSRAVLAPIDPQAKWYHDNDTPDTAWLHGTSYEVLFTAVISRNDVWNGTLYFWLMEADGGQGDDPLYYITLPCASLEEGDAGKEVRIRLTFCVQCGNPFGMTPAGLHEYFAYWNCSFSRGDAIGQPQGGEPLEEGEDFHEFVLADENGVPFGASYEDCYPCSAQGPDCRAWQYWWVTGCGGDPAPEPQRSREVTEPASASAMPGSGRRIEPSRDVCWSEPADIDDAKISSDVICQYGLESEVANDFRIDTDGTIVKAIGYGGPYNWVEGDPDIFAYNLRFYTDANCRPDALLESFLHAAAIETFLGLDAYGYPTYKLEIPIAFSVIGGTRYWFSLQADDHPFPPQWGRQGTGGRVTWCDTMFRSAFFGYPDWVPASDIGPWDAAQEFECGIPVAAESSSWGRVRALFR